MTTVQAQTDDIEKIKELYRTNPTTATQLIKNRADICVEEGKNEYTNYDSILPALVSTHNQAKERLVSAENELAKCRRNRAEIISERAKAELQHRACAEAKTMSKPETENQGKL